MKTSAPNGDKKGGKRRSIRSERNRGGVISVYWTSVGVRDIYKIGGLGGIQTYSLCSLEVAPILVHCCSGCTTVTAKAICRSGDFARFILYRFYRRCDVAGSVLQVATSCTGLPSYDLLFLPLARTFAWIFLQRRARRSRRLLFLHLSKVR